MDSLFVLIPITFVLLATALGAYLWAVRSGQFDDLDREARRILYDEEPPTETRPDPSDDEC